MSAGGCGDRFVGGALAGARWTTGSAGFVSTGLAVITREGVADLRANASKPSCPAGDC